MSFKIFSLQLMGKLKPVEKIEQQRAALENDYQEFLRVEKSEELAEFFKLEKWLNSDEFKKEKAKIESLQFKGSTESKQLEEFKKLEKAKHLKRYFAVVDSADLKRYESLQDSDKLKTYDELYEYIKEGQFQKDKKEIEGQVFKGSVEEKHMLDFKRLGKSAEMKAYYEFHETERLKRHERFAESEKLKNFLTLKNASELDKPKKAEFKRLRKDGEIKAYFKLEHSKELKLYRETEGSHELKKYLDLKSYIEKKEFKEREAFLKDKKKFEKSEAYRKQKEFKNLAADSDVKFYLKFEKSTLYKNYLDVKDSFDLKRFNELKELTSSKEFLERKAYLEDKKKWEKTEAFALQQKYPEMKKQPHLVNYFKYKNSTDFDFFRDWEVAFEDDFSLPDLQAEKWSVCSYWAEKTLGSNYSLPGDLQIFTDGKNLKTGSKLAIEVLKEKQAGKIWKMPAGFIPVEFDYSSGLVSTGKSFWMNDGIIEAKIKFQPLKEIVSSFYLLGEKNTPRLNLLEMGVKNRLGFTSFDGNGKVKWEGLDISNLKSGQSYIFTIEKTGSTFTWKINETVVLKMDKPELNSSLHLNASSLVVYDVPDTNLPVRFEIDWVKCFQKK
jgi:hypothetical protein